MELKKTLFAQNYWWKEKIAFDFKDRDIDIEISKFITEPQILAITGIRRVGKTTYLLSLINKLIKNGTNPEAILFVSFDELKTQKIRDILETYESIIENKKFQKTYLFLDEIQKLKDWENQIKSIYDEHKLKNDLKIFISGSESLFIRKKSKETLAGRIFEFKMNQLSFKEYLNFKDLNYKNIQLYEKELLIDFNNFILTQGFPEMLNYTDYFKLKKYTNEITEKIIFGDIAKQFKITNLQALESIVKIISNNPGQLLDQTDLGSEINVVRQVVSNYLKYLEESYLIKKQYNYSNNFRKTERKLKKYYPTILSPEIILDEDYLSKSKVFETFIINQLNSNFFWRDAYKNEVDMIFEKNKTIVPIEIKYGKVETEGLDKFMSNNNVSVGYIISLNIEKKIQKGDKTIYVIPAYKFLLNKDKYL